MSTQRPDRLDASFGKLWAASTMSALGTGLSMVAAPLFVASLTASPLVVSAAFGVAWTPYLLFSLPGGVLVDRVDRRRLMVVIDWVRVIAMAALGVTMVTGHADVALLYAVLFVVNTGEALFRPAGQAMIPAVVPRSKLERANGWMTGGTTLMQELVGSPLGGLLFVISAAIPFLVNAGTYAVSAILIGLVAGSYRPAARDDSIQAGDRQRSVRSVWADLNEGLRWLSRQRLLRTMAILMGLLNMTLAGATAVLVLLARHRLGMGSVGFGLLFTCAAVGGIIGAVIGDRLIKWVTPTWTMRIGLVVEAGFHLVLATARSPYFAGAAFFAFGIHASLWTIASSSLRQRLTPPDMLGRVSASYLFITSCGNCLGALVAGAIASSFGITAPYWVAFVVASIVCITTWPVFNRATVAEAYAPGGPHLGTEVVT
jgi:MFS family permease